MIIAHSDLQIEDIVGLFRGALNAKREEEYKLSLEKLKEMNIEFYNKKLKKREKNFNNKRCRRYARKRK